MNDTLNETPGRRALARALTALSDVEVLALVVGSKRAAGLYAAAGGSLRTLFRLDDRHTHIGTAKLRSQGNASDLEIRRIRLAAVSELNRRHLWL